MSFSKFHKPPKCPDLDFHRQMADSGNAVASRSKVKVQRKRKRINGDSERNVKKKSVKNASPHDASSPVPPAASDDEVTFDFKIPKRRRGMTRYTAAKQQLNEVLEETVRLKNVIALLESEIDSKNKELSKLHKTDVSQKSEIKRLSILVDYQKHELRKDTVSSRDVPDPVNSSSSLNTCGNDSSNGDPIVNNRRQKPSVPHSKSIVDCDAPRSQPESPLEPSATALPCRRVAVIGSSVVLGVGLGLNKRGMDAVTFTYPGYEVPQITELISSILTKSYQPDTVVLQCGGNDLQNNRPPAEVMNQIDILVQEVKRCRPGATVVVNHDDVIKWKHFPRYWPFVRGIHRSRWIPRSKASDAELWCFLWSTSE